MAQDILRQYQIVNALNSATWAIGNPILVPFLLSRGLSLAETGFLFAILRITTVVFEIPTGAFADAYGRKTSAMLSFGLCLVGFSGFLLAPGFGELLLPAAIIGLADAFFSGSMEAWAVDKLKERGVDRSHTQRLLAGGVSAMYLVLLVGSLVGGWVGSYSMEAAILMGFPAMLIGMAYVWNLPERRPRKGFTASLGPIIGKMAQTVRRCSSDPRLVTLLAISSLLGAGCFRLFVAWQPAFAGLFGWGPFESGVLFASISLAVIAGSKSVEKREAVGLTLGHVLLLMGAVVLVSAVWWSPWPTLFAFLVFEAGNGAQKPLMNRVLHQRAPSAIRATAVSLFSAAFSAGFGLMGVFYQWAGDMSISSSWVASGLILLFAAALAFRERI